jgi:hypothetical protein
MKKFIRAPGTCTQPGNPVLNDLVYGWGNETWSALDEYLAGCVKHALSSPGPILECGSGLSTIVVGAIAQKYGKKLWTLEHRAEWALKLTTYLKKYKIDSVTLNTKPLKDYGEYCWYEPNLRTMPDRFTLVICDGPPGTTKGGRYGLVPVVGNKIKPGCVILLDDAGRKEELAIARKWASELHAPFKILGTAKPYIEMLVLNGRFLHTAE